MRLHQFYVAPLVLDDSLLRIALANFFDKQCKLYFIWDKYSQLAICLRLIEPN